MKKKICCQYFFQFVIYFLVTIAWGLWMTNAKRIDDTYTSWCRTASADISFDQEDLLVDCKKSYYDYAWIQGPIRHAGSNQKVVNNLLDYCDLSLSTKTDDLDDLYKEGKLSCIEDGNHWHEVYNLGFSLSLILAVTTFLMMFAGKNFYARLIGF